MMNENFLWGAACAANQYEGGFSEGGRTLSTADCVTGGGYQNPRKITGTDQDGNVIEIEVDSTMTGTVPADFKGCLLDDVYYPSHQATDFYHHWQEDIALMAELGLRCFRMSVSWSRICPDGGYEVNEEGIRFYQQIFKELRKNGIEPVVTLAHFDMPLWLADDSDGWKSEKTIDRFLFFARTAFERFRGQVHYWMTFNEVNVLSGWYQTGVRENTAQNMAEAQKHIFLASALAVKIGHEIDTENRIGMMAACTPGYPMTCRPKDVMESIIFNRQKYFYIDVQARGYYPEYKIAEYRREGLHFNLTDDEKKILKDGTVDFIGFSYYMSTACSTDPNAEKTEGNQFIACRNPYLSTSDWGWTVDPLGLRIMINELYDRYHKPLFIVENGLGAVDQKDEKGEIQDDYRIGYLRSHIQAMKDAIDIDGADVIGYTPWSAVDIVSAGTGEMKKRYGFVFVERYDEGTGDFSRKKKKSFSWYQKVISSNGEDLSD